jgi:hypothetical protein
MRRLLWIAVLLLSVSLVLAANNPGHDTLYVLKIGDNITGPINITSNLTATLVQATSRFFGPNLDIRGDGTSAGTANQIVGSSSDLSISASTLILNKAVTGGWVHIGWTGTTTGLNVSGAITQAGVNVCLANGTNCLSGNNSGNVSIVNADSPLSSANQNGPTVTLSLIYGGGLTLSGSTLTIDNASVCRSDGTGCPSSATSGSGWANSSNLIWTVSNSTNISISNTTGSVPLLFIDATHGKVGIGTNISNNELEVVGTINATAINVGTVAVLTGSTDVVYGNGTNGDTRYIKNNSIVTFTSLTAGTANIGTTNLTTTQISEGVNLYYTDARAAKVNWLQNSSTTLVYSATNTSNLSIGNYSSSSYPLLFIDTQNQRVGIGTNTTTQALDVNGNVNVSKAAGCVYLGDASLCGNTTQLNLTLGSNTNLTIQYGTTTRFRVNATCTGMYGGPGFGNVTAGAC